MTTSSCSGRVSVFLEGRKKGKYVRGGGAGGGINRNQKQQQQEEVEKEEEGEVGVMLPPGGKGNGGRWLFVSHDPVMDVARVMAAVGGGVPGCVFDDNNEDGDVDVNVNGKGPISSPSSGISWRREDGHGHGHGHGGYAARSGILGGGGGDGGGGGEGGAALRLVRFQFEPMVCTYLTLSIHILATLLEEPTMDGATDPAVSINQSINQSFCYSFIHLFSSFIH